MNCAPEEEKLISINHGLNSTNDILMSLNVIWIDGNIDNKENAEYLKDIKLDNLLVHFPTEEDKKNLNMLKAKIKITDFGFARY